MNSFSNLFWNAFSELKLFLKDWLEVVLVVFTMGKIFYFTIQQGIPCRCATSLFLFYYFPLEMQWLLDAFIFASYVIWRAFSLHSTSIWYLACLMYVYKNSLISKRVTRIDLNGQRVLQRFKWNNNQHKIFLFRTFRSYSNFLQVAGTFNIFYSLLFSVEYLKQTSDFISSLSDFS